MTLKDLRPLAKFMEADADEALRRANLTRTDPRVVGITRKGEKHAKDEPLVWKYTLPNGKLISDKSEIERINALAIPPAWADVWICPDPRGHLQALGSDTKGRKQYRYHPDWTAVKAAMKYDGITGFADVLPTLRAQLSKDLNSAGGSNNDASNFAMHQEKVVALVVRLMDLYHIRVGSDEYARKNDSYGLTTLKEGHMKIDRSKDAEGELDAIFSFTGKSGKEWNVRILEDDLAELIELSGKVGRDDDEEDLFRYTDNSGKDYDIKAEHINAYIREVTGQGYTAKDFRTWAATAKTGARISELLDEREGEILSDWITQFKRPEALQKAVKDQKIPLATKKARQKALLALIDTVAGDLGNTRTVCRSSYIHPALMDDFIEERFAARWKKSAKKERKGGLSNAESTVLHYLNAL